MPKLVLIRGLPGSGKSTIAKEISSEYGFIHCEQDMFHLIEGIYQWRASNMPSAFKYCYNSTSIALSKGYNVVVSNTFIRIKSIRPYLKLCDKILILEAKGHYDNIHNVPLEILEKMSTSWQELPVELLHLKGDYSDSTLFFKGI